MPAWCRGWSGLCRGASGRGRSSAASARGGVGKPGGDRLPLGVAGDRDPLGDPPAVLGLDQYVAIVAAHDPAGVPVRCQVLAERAERALVAPDEDVGGVVGRWVRRLPEGEEGGDRAGPLVEAGVHIGGIEDAVLAEDAADALQARIVGNVPVVGEERLDLAAVAVPYALVRGAHRSLLFPGGIGGSPSAAGDRCTPVDQLSTKWLVSAIELPP